MIRKCFTILGLGATILYAKSDTKVCYSYNPDNFYISAIGDKREFKRDIESLEIYFSKKSIFNIKSNTPYKSAVIAYRVGKHQHYLVMDSCEKLDEDRYPRCSLECDGGSFMYNRDFSFYIDYGLALSNPNDIYEVELSQKKRKAFIKGKRIECPKNISKLFTYYTPKKSKKEAIDPKGRYVCYDYKFKNVDTGRWEYSECHIYKRHCKDYRLSYFGHYPTLKATKDALKRCKSSHPNLDYVDNPKGRYVCYDYNDIYGNFIGCFRSKKDCKLLHKKRFGKYSNSAKTEDALYRCQVGLTDD